VKINSCESFSLSIFIEVTFFLRFVPNFSALCSHNTRSIKHQVSHIPSNALRHSTNISTKFTEHLYKRSYLRCLSVGLRLKWYSDPCTRAHFSQWFSNVSGSNFTPLYFCLCFFRPAVSVYYYFYPAP